MWGLQQLLSGGSEAECREDDWLFNGERPRKVKRENEAEEPE